MAVARHFIFKIQKDEDVNYENVRPKTTAKETDPQKILQSVKRRYRIVGFSLGLLSVVVQALIIIALRLTLYQNLIEERDELKARYDNLMERDDIKKILCESHGFAFGGGVCYYISTEKKTWEESRQYCRNNQSDLLVINSREKQEFVVMLNQDVWLGLTDREKEGQFQWVDGTPLTTPTYWDPGQPNNTGAPPDAEQNCVEFSNRLNMNQGWNDISCFATNYWICERVIY